MERMQHLKKYSDRLSRKGSRRSTEKARANTSRGNPRNTEKKKIRKTEGANEQPEEIGRVVTYKRCR